MKPPLLLRAPGPATKARIANFGIELEVLPRNYSDDDDDDGYCCEDCDGDPDDWNDRHRAKPTNSAAKRAYLDAFVDNGLLSYDDTDIHPYHCCCSRCEHGRSFPHFTAQTDPTVGIEFVSRILNAFDDHEVVMAAIDAHETGMTRSGWRPDGDQNNGNHIHISKSGEDNGGANPFARGTQAMAASLTKSLFALGSWDMVAAGGCRKLRSYNGQKPNKGFGESVTASRDSYHSWLSDRGYGTMEFRLWNTPAVASRIAAHVGLSLAVARWAFCQVIHDRAALSAMTMSEMSEILADRPDDLREVILGACPPAFAGPAAEALALL